MRSFFHFPSRVAASNFGDGAMMVIIVIVTAGLALAQRDFAKLHINIGSLWLFPLDIALAASLVILALGVLGVLRQKRERSLWLILGLIFIYLVGGFLYFAEAAIPYGLSAARDFAYVYYALWAVVFYVWGGITKQYRLLTWLFVIGVSVAATRNYWHAIIDFGPMVERTRFSEVYGYGSGPLGLYSAFVFVIILARLALPPGVKFWPLWVVALVLHWGNIILTQTRSVYLGLVAGLVVLAVLSFGRWGAFRRGGLLLGCLILGTMLLWYLGLPNARVAQHIEGAWNAALSAAPSVKPSSSATPSVKPASGAAPSVKPTESVDLELEMDDATGIWRLEKWKEGWALFLASPVLGQGFGRPVNTLKMERPVSDDEFNLGLPHNTFLVSLVRQGILGTSVLLGVVGVWFWVTIKSLRTASPPTRRDMVTLIAIVVMCLPYGFFSLFFESPYLAFPFWATIGLGMVLAGRATE